MILAGQIYLVLKEDDYGDGYDLPQGMFANEEEANKFKDYLTQWSKSHGWDNRYEVWAYSLFPDCASAIESHKADYQEEDQPDDVQE